MIELEVFNKIGQYGSYLLVTVLGWFLRRHVERSERTEMKQDERIEMLDKRIDSHDVSRADIKAQINAIHDTLKKIDRNIDKLLDKS